MKLGTLVALVGLFLLSGCSGPEDVTLRLTVERFRDCNHMRDYAQNRRDAYAKAVNSRRSGKAMSENTTAMAGGDAGGFVNLQESGVDEPDYFRISDSRLYFARANRIEVTQRQTLQHLGALDTGALRNLHLFTEKGKLVVLGQDQGTTEARFYREEGSLPVLKETIRIEGVFKAARLVEGRLVLLVTGHGYGYGELDSALEALQGTECSDVTIPFVNDIDFRFSHIITLDTEKPKEGQRDLFVMGVTDHLYMTKDSIYLAKEGTYWPMEGNWDHFIVAKVHFEASTGKISVAAVGSVHGIAKDQWAFKDYPALSAVAVATTTRSENWSSTNHLWVLQQREDRLEVVSGVHDFGKNEDIRAIRYVGNMAYVVTFQKTDPLFAIDMTNPLEPRMQGELVVPGFSTYLHPAAGGKLVGLGFGALQDEGFSWFQGIQVSLFDVRDPKSLLRLDSHEIGSRHSYSEATGDHHAFYFDDARQTSGFPYAELTQGSMSDQPTLQSTGAILYRVTETLQEKARLSHRRWMTPVCENRIVRWQWWKAEAKMIDINRMVNIDGTLLTASRFGLIAHDLEDPRQEIRALRFPVLADSMLCPADYNEGVR